MVHVAAVDRIRRRAHVEECLPAARALEHPTPLVSSPILRGLNTRGARGLFQLMKQNYKFKNLTGFKEIYLTCIRYTGAGNNISFCDKMFPLFRTALLLTEESEELDSLF